jgi:hypothetical protein
VWCEDILSGKDSDDQENDVMIPDHSIRISADRGGTFCDVYAWVKFSMFCF